MTSTIPMDLLMVVFAAGEGKLATIPPDIAPIIDELRARARLWRYFSLPAGSSSSSPMASEGCPAAYTVTQDGCARVERLCAAHVQRLIAGGASVEPADLSQAGLCDRCAAEEHSALEARRADIARQERKRTEAEVCSLLLLLREAFDTPWAGSDLAHVAEVAALKRRIQEALGGRYSGEDMLGFHPGRPETM